MRIAYFLTSYQSPDAVLRLVRTLRRGDPDCHIVLHHDVHRTPLDQDAVREAGVHLLTSDHPIVWGDMTLEALRWRAYRWMLDNLDGFDWVVLLSEQDYPIAPLAQLKARLESADCDALLPGERADQVEDLNARRDTILRYGYEYRTMPSTGIAGRLPARLKHVLRRARVFAYSRIGDVQKRVHFYFFPEALDLPTKLGVRLPQLGYRPDFPAWFHPAWFALSRRAVECVVQYVEAHPDYVRYAARTIIPLESATGSILFNDPSITTIWSVIHYVRFSDPASGRPDVFDLDDVDELVNSGHFFARKFPLGDAAVLDALDSHVLGDGGTPPPPTA